MNRQEAVYQYNAAYKMGQKYYKNAVSRGEHPFPPVLDDILDESTVSGRVSLGVVNVPSELIVGVKSAGRVSALAANFMPILDESSEFAAKWISLCDAHLSDEGIRDAIVCFEYMGRFYVQEGNKRASVLKSYGAATIPAVVTRIVPEYTDDHDVQVYYEFMSFYQLSGLYRIQFRHRGQYAKLQAAMGYEPGHVWTEDERRSFSAGLSHFNMAFDKVNTDNLDILPCEALLSMLELFSFQEIKDQSVTELVKNLSGIWADVKIQLEKLPLEVSTNAEELEQGLLTKLFGVGKLEHATVAFIYAFDPVTSAWTKGHDMGRENLEKLLGKRVDVKVYNAFDKNYLCAMKKAVEDGAELIFATTPPMMDACRRIAAEHPDVKIFNCALYRHYAGVRSYYSRIYESKFITGAIAGAMAESDVVGYVANYPIYGVPASINAFALGVRMTNPRARVKLLWSCTEGDPLMEFAGEGITVISNRDAANPIYSHRAYDWGTYKLLEDGSMQPLAVPYWDWGAFYERVVLAHLNGALSNVHSDRAVNYWWGMGSGVINVQLSDNLPSGVRALAEILKTGITKGEISPFKTPVYDQNGVLRFSGEVEPSAEELMEMDWFCDNVDGALPSFDQLLPHSLDMVKLLGIIPMDETTEREENKA